MPFVPAERLKFEKPELKKPGSTDRFGKMSDPFLFFTAGKDVLLCGTEFPRLTQIHTLLDGQTLLELGEMDGVPCWGIMAETFPEKLPDGIRPVMCRDVFAAFHHDWCLALCRARIQLQWLQNHRFCGKCAARTVPAKTDIGLACPACGARFFPQIAPAVIVLVTRGERILLAHNRQFTNGMYGLAAGFVEAGESAEDAVTRELMEEVGISVKNVTYVRSQSWPFPNSLMLGFRAEYASGELRPDGKELDDAGWFSHDALPMIPPPGSIARTLIDEWLEIMTEKKR